MFQYRIKTLKYHLLTALDIRSKNMVEITFWYQVLHSRRTPVSGIHLFQHFILYLKLKTPIHISSWTRIASV